MNPYNSAAIASAFLCALLTAPVEAKIVDFPSITVDKVIYESHDNYVEAIDQNTGKRIWKTSLFDDIYKEEYNPRIEKDAQLNIACIRTISGSDIIVADSKGRTFHVDTRTGKLLFKTIPEH